MEPKFAKIAKGISALLIAVGAILTIIMMMKGDEAVKESPDSTNGLLNISYLSLIAGILVTVISAVTGIMKNPEALKKSLIGIGFVGGILLISYFISSGADYVQYQSFNVDEATSKWVSTGLNMFYITGFLAILAVIWSSFGRILK